MSTCTELETVKAAKKPHVCSWCGTRIAAAESYVRWRCYDGSDAGTVKMHPECKEALDGDEWSQDDGEFYPHSNPRGCNCGHSAGCPTCAARAAGVTA